MMKNTLMEPFWRESRRLPWHELPSSLQDVLSAGWILGPSQSVLLRAMHGPGWRTDWSVGDVARHEFEANDLNVPASGLSRDREGFLVGLTSRARTAAELGLTNARGFEFAESLTAVISMGIDDDFLTHGATVKFFTRRNGYPRYFDDLERFKLEAMAILDASDIEASE